MRKLVIFLSLTTAIFAASTVYLLTERRAPSVPPPVVASAGAAVVAPPASGVSAPSPVTERRPSTAVAAPPGAPRLSDLDRRFLADAADPARRLDLVAGTKASFKAEYQRLAQVVGLGPEEYERLLGYLAEQQVTSREGYLHCRADATRSPDACPVDLGLMDENLLALLGPERQKRFENYLTSLQERRLVSRVRGVLPDDQFLPDDKADQLIAALSEENQRRSEQLGDALHGPDVIYSEVPLIYTAGATRESLVAEAREHYDRLRARAARVLSPAQLKTWDSIMEQRFGGVEYSIQSFLERRAQK